MSVIAEQASPFQHVQAVEPRRSWLPFDSLRRTRRFYDVLAAVVVVIVVLFAIGPIVWTVLTSFKTESEIVSRDFTYLPTLVTFDNYVTLWQRSGYPRLLHEQRHRDRDDGVACRSRSAPSRPTASRAIGSGGAAG